ncbi:UNVERIFIED_CONTAM: Retrovirus-related Pol polyprotein from transposon RE2 [Sesamum angustifolium]|uniref:Retrovirus-related Pol polyprotein from transposon RE2 n=1 Tax=Sesamum angustifolium TaxID=2727405 RepID=A0AAW2NZE9_9LAMI
MRSDSCFLALIVYVDDVLLTGSSIDDLVAVKTYLDDLFTIKYLGHAKYFLGLELARSSHGTYVTQQKYLQDIVHDCNLQDAKAAATPLSPGLKLDTDSGALLESLDRYRRLIGRLLYLGSLAQIFHLLCNSSVSTFNTLVSLTGTLLFT